MINTFDINLLCVHYALIEVREVYMSKYVNYRVDSGLADLIRSQAKKNKRSATKELESIIEKGVNCNVGCGKDNYRVNGALSGDLSRINNNDLASEFMKSLSDMAHVDFGGRSDLRARLDPAINKYKDND